MKRIEKERSAGSCPFSRLLRQAVNTVGQFYPRTHRSIALTDNGSQFLSKEFTTLLENYGVKAVRTPYYHPQSNPTERVNRVVKTAIRAYVNDNQKHWDKLLQKIAFALRTAKHESTGYTPVYLNFGRELQACSDNAQQNITNPDELDVAAREAFAQKFNKVKYLWSEVVKNLTNAYEKAKRTYNLRRREVSYAPGQVVWKREFLLSDASKDFSSKLAPKYKKCTVLQKISNTAYELGDENDRNLGIWHPKDMKPQPETG
ncbi:uncharacterized protein [Rhodnius prolixus]|uniref:uncharacterized protein n=1 Tax=Rhodnius prolixus TaxID=13249 RepID=UPI003D18C137